MEELPLRYTGGAGQGGGGALSVAELDAVFRVDSDSQLVAPESVIHTDSAKSYKRLGPFRWPGPGALHGAYELGEGEERPDHKRMSQLFEQRYLRHKWVYAVVVHKKKFGENSNWAVTRRIRLADGTWTERKGGTQTIDGFWARLRLNVARKGVQSGPAGSLKRSRLAKLVREYQWRYWYLHEDKMVLFCELVRECRDRRMPADFASALGGPHVVS